MFQTIFFIVQGPLNFADVSIFCTKSVFLDKNSPFVQSIMKAVLKILYFCIQLLLNKGSLLINLFMRELTRNSKFEKNPV